MVGGSDKDKLKDSPGLGIFGGLSTTRPVISNTHPHSKSEHYQSFISHLNYTHYPMTVTNARPRMCHFLHNWIWSWRQHFLKPEWETVSLTSLSYLALWFVLCRLITETSIIQNYKQFTYNLWLNFCQNKIWSCHVCTSLLTYLFKCITFWASSSLLIFQRQWRQPILTMW